MTDPYDDEKLLDQRTRAMMLETDVRSVARTPPIRHLASILHGLQRIADPRVPYRSPRVWPAEDDRMRPLNRSKSERIAQFVREREPLPLPVKAGFGMAGLLAFAGGALLWRRWRNRIE